MIRKLEGFGQKVSKISWLNGMFPPFLTLPSFCRQVGKPPWFVILVAPALTHFSSLNRSGTERRYPRELLHHPFIVANEQKKVNMAKWVAALCDWT